MTSPWVSRYQLGNALDTDARFGNIERHAVAIALTARNPAADVELLEAQLKKVFICTDQCKAVLVQLLALAFGHCELHFPSAQAIVAGLYKEWPWGKEEDLPPAVVLTGLAGVGKSTLLNAFQRLLAGVVWVDLPGHKGMSLLPAWFMTLRDGTGLNDLLTPQIYACDRADQMGDSARKTLKHDALLKAARKRSYLQGVCLALVDEFQFISRGAYANAKATNLLLQLFSIGPRLVYSANYSLVHSLKLRKQEDRQRLLRKHIHLRPDDLRQPDGLRVLNEFMKVAPDDFDLKPSDIAEQIQEDSYGIDRLIIQLLCLGWERAKTSRGRKAKVTADDLRWAYFSEQYEINREDVEVLHKQDITREMVRQDLWDPFYQEAEKARGCVIEASRAINEFEKRVEEERTLAFMTPQERRGWEALQEATAEKGRAMLNATSARSGKRTKEGLAQALRLIHK